MIKTGPKRAFAVLRRSLTLGANGKNRTFVSRLLFSISLLSVACFLLSVFCYADTIETKYFTVTLCDNCSLSSFAERISATSFFRLDAQSDKTDIRSVIKEGIDSLFLEVSDVLDIHLKTYHARLIIYPDVVEVSEAAYGDAQIIEANLPSVYIPSHNTIYISFADITAGMLAHEMAHALINNYFVVAPPPKVQEILAGYVEYMVRKKMGSLP